MDVEAIRGRILGALPQSVVRVEDLQGGDHISVTVVSPAFAGKSRMQQHQLIYGLFKAEMATEEIHALALKTFTPEEYAKFESGAG